MTAGQGKTVNIALQGGGSHGAFTWGVLDRLLEEERLQFEGVSGTSAGAMNAAIMAQGYADGGRAGARAALADFWESVSRFALYSPVRRTPLERLAGTWNLDHSPGAWAVEAVERLSSPWQRGASLVDPLRAILRERIKPDLIGRCPHLKLFVSATNVETGKARIFRNAEITIEALMASACLPHVYEAVTIDGVPYWDGGYMGNPAVWPFIYECESRDIVVVQVNPLTRPGVPRTNPEIADRLNEITFNGALIAEMRAIAFAQKLLEEDRATGPAVDRLRHMLVHIVEDEDRMRPLGAVSKLNVEIEFLRHLRDLGRAAAEGWLAANFDALGERSSVDIRERFL